MQERTARIVLGMSEVLVAEALAGLLREAGYPIVGWHDSPDRMLEAVRRCRPELVLVDPDIDAVDGGSQMLEMLRRVGPSSQVVIVAGAVDTGLARAAVRYGVRGVILRSDPLSEAVGVLERVLHGQSVYPRAVIDRLAAPDPVAPLSARQREVLELLAAGRSNDEIAARLFISRNTVKFHLRVIYERLGVRNRVEAADVQRGHRPVPSGP